MSTVAARDVFYVSRQLCIVKQNQLAHVVYEYFRTTDSDKWESPKKNPVDSLGYTSAEQVEATRNAFALLGHFLESVSVLCELHYVRNCTSLRDWFWDHSRELALYLHVFSSLSHESKSFPLFSYKVDSFLRAFKAEFKDTDRDSVKKQYEQKE